MRWLPVAAAVLIFAITAGAFFLTDGFRSAEVRDLQKEINAIGEVTLDTARYIELARENYDRLQPNDKERVKNLAMLETAEEQYALLVTKKNAADFDAQTAKLGDITLDSEEMINNLRSAYNALSQEEKGYVTSEKSLVNAEEQLRMLHLQQRAEKADERIAALGEITLGSDKALEAVYDEVSELPQEVRSLMKNLPLLKEKQDTLEKLREKSAYDSCLRRRTPRVSEVALMARWPFCTCIRTAPCAAKWKLFAWNAICSWLHNSGLRN